MAIILCFKIQWILPNSGIQKSVINMWFACTSLEISHIYSHLLTAFYYFFNVWNYRSFSSLLSSLQTFPLTPLLSFKFMACFLVLCVGLNPCDLSHVYFDMSNVLVQLIFPHLCQWDFMKVPSEITRTHILTAHSFPITLAPIT